MLTRALVGRAFALPSLRNPPSSGPAEPPTSTSASNVWRGAIPTLPTMEPAEPLRVSVPEPIFWNPTVLLIVGLIVADDAAATFTTPDVCVLVPGTKLIGPVPLRV